MSRIFIGYRHDDGGHAWAVHQHLLLWFDAQDIFIDHARLASGEQFQPALEKELEQCHLFLAVIGQHWFSDKNRDRLQDPNDITRGELRTALERGIPVIPVLCGGATLSCKNELPADIAPFCDGQHHPLPDSEHFHALNRLIDQLRNAYGFTPRYRPPHGVTQALHLGEQKLSPYFSDPVDALGRLRRMLGAKGEAAVVGQETLQGMGGVGKTQLALKYCTEFREQYAGVWWFKAESLLQMQQDCQYFCTKNKVTLAEGEPPHQAVAHFLRQQPRWLLVYDNAEAEYGPEKEHLRPYLPEGDHHLLITARSPEVGRIDETLPLDVWSEDEALPFLRGRLAGAKDNDLRRLTQTLGGLPLALEQACAYLKKTGSSVAAYCAAVNDLERGKGLLDRRAAQEYNYPHSAFATLSLAFDKLSDAAKELLRLCAWCAAEPIPELVFRNEMDLLPEALRQAAADDLLWGETVAELTGFALVQRMDVDLTPPGVQERNVERALLFHRFTQAVVIHGLGDPVVDATSLTDLIEHAYPDDLTATTGWPLARVLAPHVLRLEEHYTTGYVPLHSFTSLTNRLATFLQVGWTLYDQAEKLFRSNLVRMTEKLGVDHPDTLTSMNNLAQTLFAMGDHQGAKTYQQQVLALRSEKFGADHLDTLTSKGNLAGTLKAMGDYQGARRYEEQVLTRRSEQLGADHPDTLRSMDNLAATLHSMGDLQGARTYQVQVVARRTEKLGADHPETLMSMNNLAQTLYSMGDHYGARTQLEQVLARMTEKLGENHLDTLTSMGNLAETLNAMGDQQGAMRYLEQVFARRTEKLGADHPATLTSKGNLAITLYAMGEHQGAMRYLEQVLARRTEKLGADHPDTLKSMNNLAQTLYAMGDHHGARTYQEHVLARRKEKFGTVHPETTTAAWCLFRTFDALGDRAAAQSIITMHLVWLLADGLELHSGVQRQIRDMLQKIVGAPAKVD